MIIQDKNVSPFDMNRRLFPTRDGLTIFLLSAKIANKLILHPNSDLCEQFSMSFRVLRSILIALLFQFDSDPNAEMHHECTCPAVPCCNSHLEARIKVHLGQFPIV